MRVHPEIGMDHSETVSTFLRLFDGYQERHLELSGPASKNAKGKVTTKKTATVPGPITPELVLAHLGAEASMGVAPQRADSSCVYGVLDIDWYDMPEDEVRAVADRLRTRCAAFRTKSRGLHIYVFTDSPVTARQMHDYLVILRKRLPKATQKKTELFPKATQMAITPDAEPSAVNFPLHGTQREPAFVIDGNGIKAAPDEMSVHALLRYIDDNCRLRASTVASYADETPTMDASEIGYRIPDNPAGRNDLLMRIGMSMQSRGWPDTDLEAEIRRLNGDANFHHLFADGALPESEIAPMLKSIKRREKGTPTPLHYRMVEKFNREWAVMRVAGRVEFLNREEDQCYPKQSFQDATAPRTVQLGKQRVPVSALWLQDIDRAEYCGIVTESPDYDGPGWNVFRGWACDPIPGDASLWVQYITETLCSGDEALAHWVMTYLADAVQRPWSTHPGSALALRGGQGGGKSFLGRAMRKLVGPAHAQTIVESDRMFARFNRGLFGSTFVLCEESLFAGSSKQAAIAKGFITSDLWTYEQKYLASFDAKNVHRIIATTNEEQAVHVDHDDRRWTVIEVPTRFEDHGQESRAWWEPYYRLIDDNPGIVLDYLMNYEVDRGLIQYGHVTDAKASDKVASDPMTALMDEIAQSGVLPDDIRGEGSMSSATLARECYARGASRRTVTKTFSNQARKKFGAKTKPNCVHIEGTHRGQSMDGILTVTPLYRTDRAGLQFPPLDEFRQIVAKITRKAYPEGGKWGAWAVAGPGFEADPNGGSAEKFIREHGRSDDAWKPYDEDDQPF